MEVSVNPIIRAMTFKWPIRLSSRNCTCVVKGRSPRPWDRKWPPILTGAATHTLMGPQLCQLVRQLPQGESVHVVASKPLERSKNTAVP